MTWLVSALISSRKLAAAIWKRRRDISHVSVLGYATLLVIFLLQVAIVRLLSIENFGIYSTNLAMVALLEVPLILRSSEIAMRALGESWRNMDGNLIPLAQRMVHRDRRLFISMFVLLAIAALVAYGALGVDPWLMLILALMIPAQAGYGVFRSYFMIFDKVRIMVRYELIYAILLAGLNLTGLMLWGVYGLAASMALAALMKTYLAYFFTRNYPPKATFVTTTATLPSLTNDGVLSVVRNLLANTFNQIDIVLLGQLQRPEVVALYKVGKSLASLPIKISFPLWRYLQPKLMEAIQSGNRIKERRIVFAGSAVLVSVMLCLAPVVLMFGESVLVFLYGEAYREAFHYFLILLVGIAAFHGIFGWFKLWAVVTDAQLYGIWVYAVAVVSVIVLGAIFGAASPVSMAYIVSVVLLGMSGAAFARVFRP